MVIAAGIARAGCDPDQAQVGAGRVTDWRYEATARLISEATAGAVTKFSLGEAGNREPLQAPDGMNTCTWESDNGLFKIALPHGGTPPHALPPGRPSHGPPNREGDTRLVRRAEGSSSRDILDKRQP